MTDSVGLICNAGACANLPPEVAILLIALDSLVKELSADEPFGPNNEIVKALKTAQSDLLSGVGENNDIKKALENAWKDITSGLGENNDIRVALERIGIKI